VGKGEGEGEGVAVDVAVGEGDGVPVDVGVGVGDGGVISGVGLGVVSPFSVELPPDELPFTTICSVHVTRAVVISFFGTCGILHVMEVSLQVQ
jgi:hypothetical protein